MTFPPPEFRIWCVVVDLRLREYTGRPLADAPVPESWLRIWWAHGIPARVVAGALSTRMPRVRATFERFYTDKRAEELRRAVVERTAG